MILHKMIEGYTLTETGDIDNIIAISDIQLAKDYNFYLLDINQCIKLLPRQSDVNTIHVDIEKKWVNIGYDNIIEYVINKFGYVNIFEY